MGYNGLQGQALFPTDLQNLSNFGFYRLQMAEFCQLTAPTMRDMVTKPLTSDLSFALYL